MRNIKIIAATIASLYFFPAKSQLISNGDFETVGTHAIVINGHQLWSSNNYPSGWLQPTDGTPDVITSYSSSSGIGACYNPAWQTSNGCFPQVCNYDNFNGCENMRTGNNNYNFMGITTAGLGVNYNSSEFREYLQAPIVDTDPNTAGDQGLKSGQCYQITMWVSLGDMMKLASAIQVYITPTQPTQYGNWAGNLPTNMPGSQLLSSKIVDKKNGWQQLTFPFTAIGGEQFITIGFFEGENSPRIADSQSSSTPGCSSTTCTNSLINNAYYYIDDVQMYPSASSSFLPDVSISGSSFSGTYTNKNILLSGNVQVNSNLTLIGCTVKCTNNTVINVQSNVTMSVNTSTISAGCDHMWQGITGALNSHILVSNSTISDAVMAIKSTLTELHVSGSTFSRNERDMEVSSSSNSSYIKGTTFDHNTLLKDQAYGINGYGISGVTIKNNTGNFQIGGTNTSDICFFHGGQFGIIGEAANINVERVFIDGVKQTAIDFQGNAPNNYIRKLTVKSSTFINNKRHILSQHKTDLTVQYSSFTYAQEHAIEWSDNHDCHLLIGDPSIPQAGNTFYGNVWTAVTAVDNKTAFNGSPFSLATGSSSLYTTIVIANNQVTAPSYSAGFLIVEWSLGSQVSYNTLDISSNTVNNTVKGAQIYNIRGWGGIPGFPTTGIPPQQLKSNMFYTTTAQVSNPYGARIANTKGLTVKENGVSSDNTGNYLNNGLIFENSESTDIKENIISAGTGIACGLDMLNSNIHCNILANYAVGINLGWTYLRSGSTDLHGSAIEQFSNSTNAGIPWNEDIAVYNSQVSHNQWVWNNANSFLTITYSGNTGSGSVISNTTGVERCNQILGNYAFAEANNHVIFANDPVAQWRSDYSYEIQRLNTGDGDSTIASSNIKAIIRIENLIGSQNYAEALNELNALTPANVSEQNYKSVLTVISNINYPVRREPTTDEIASLTAVAQQYARTAGASVTIARAYLAAKFNTYFADEDYAEGELAGTAELKTPCSFLPSSGTTLDLMDENGNALDITGTYVNADGSFTFDPHQLSYYSGQNPTTTYRIYAKKGSTYTVVDKSFHTISDWINSSPINLKLSGVLVMLDTLTSAEYMQIDNYMSMADGSGNTISVSTALVGASTDFLIEKRDPVGDLIWSKTYNGVVSGNDSATCMNLDNEGNVYVAGKVWNGRSYDLQALKYDTDGFLVWSSILADPQANQNTPTGITVDQADGSVHITGTSISSSKSGYRYVHFWQCLPSFGRTGNPAIENPPAETTTVNFAQFYPNPSNGNLTIGLNGQQGGILELFNLQGQLVYSKQINQSGEISLPDAMVKDGIYLLKFTITNGSSQVSKLVIDRDN